MKIQGKIVGLFPGQGSQKTGMGKELYEAFPLAKEMFSIADQALGFSLSSICFNGPETELTRTAISQPAILTVSCICYSLAKDIAGDQFNMVAAAGHSLGEYSALVAAGAITFEDAVVLVHKRGKYMQEAVPEGEGAMLAVLGKELSEIEAVLVELDGTVEIANVNAPGQIVVSGTAAGITDFQKKASGFKMIPLSVSAPFHCRMMKPAADKLAVDLDKVAIKQAEVPVYANVTAAPVSTPDKIRQALKDQVCGQVRWVESMQAIVKDTAPEMVVEFGEGNVLSNLLKRIDKSWPREQISAAADFQK